MFGTWLQSEFQESFELVMKNAAAAAAAAAATLVTLIFLLQRG